MNDEMVSKIMPLRLLVLDVDGVLTDGRIVMSDDGQETKFFDVKDGHGLKLLMRAGVEVIWITGRRSRVVEHRARDLGVQEYHQLIWDKVQVYEEILARKGLAPAEVAYMGDDIVDVPLMKRVGFAVAVADAVEEARRAAHYVTRNRGGRGAVREVCDLIIKGQGKWNRVMERYLS
ncbi:MAG: HAD-IIIA family hydrolase [Syntrophobacterales bacterium]|nr:HAD-IIIA family hydrolase [Syntrophobacterales bacterium]